MSRHTPKRHAQPFFTPAEQAQVNAYLSDLRGRLSLSRKHTQLMLCDFEQGVRYDKEHGLTVAQSIQRLSPARLGDFYFKERTDWYPLDHAAKVYPLSMSLSRMMVFRLSGYLKHPVVPEMLQLALDFVMPRFPYFATTIKCGFFWHYVDSAMRRFSVKPETKLPCSVMRVNAGTSPSLRVVYYQNRVSVEFFHVLTDGTGALFFLRTLLAEYLRLMGNPIEEGDGVLALDAPPEPAEWSDDFIIGDQSDKKSGFADKHARQLRGVQSFELPCRVLHFNLSVDKLKALAHEKGVTITTLMLGFLMLACKEAAPSGGKSKIQIQLPVNMRRYYPSRTLRNFSMYCSIRMHPSEITTLDEILPSLAAQVEQGGKKENLDQTMALSRRLVSLLRFVPLAIKRPIAYLIYGTLSDGVFTTTFSNLGAVLTPPQMREHVDKFDFVLGPPIRNRAIFALCSYGDRAVLTVTKATLLPVAEESLYRLLCEYGLDPYMEGSD